VHPLEQERVPVAGRNEPWETRIREFESSCGSCILLTARRSWYSRRKIAHRGGGVRRNNFKKIIIVW
jgi:hypothetical protein